MAISLQTLGGNVVKLGAHRKWKQKLENTNMIINKLAIICLSCIICTSCNEGEDARGTESNQNKNDFSDSAQRNSLAEQQKNQEIAQRRLKEQEALKNYFSVCQNRLNKSYHNIFTFDDKLLEMNEKQYKSFIGKIFEAHAYRWVLLSILGKDNIDVSDIEKDWTYYDSSALEAIRYITEAPLYFDEIISNIKRLDKEQGVLKEICSFTRPNLKLKNYLFENSGEKISTYNLADLIEIKQGFYSFDQKIHNLILKSSIESQKHNGSHCYGIKGLDIQKGDFVRMLNAKMNGFTEAAMDTYRRKFDVQVKPWYEYSEDDGVLQKAKRYLRTQDIPYQNLRSMLRESSTQQDFVDKLQEYANKINPSYNAPIVKQNYNDALLSQQRFMDIYLSEIMKDERFFEQIREDFCQRLSSALLEYVRDECEEKRALASIENYKNSLDKLLRLSVKYRDSGLYSNLYYAMAPKESSPLYPQSRVFKDIAFGMSLAEVQNSSAVRDGSVKIVSDVSQIQQNNFDFSFDVKAKTKLFGEDALVTLCFEPCLTKRDKGYSLEYRLVYIEFQAIDMQAFERNLRVYEQEIEQAAAQLNENNQKGKRSLERDDISGARDAAKSGFNNIQAMMKASNEAAMEKNQALQRLDKWVECLTKVDRPYRPILTRFPYALYTNNANCSAIEVSFDSSSGKQITSAQKEWLSENNAEVRRFDSFLFYKHYPDKEKCETDINFFTVNKKDMTLNFQPCRPMSQRRRLKAAMDILYHIYINQKDNHSKNIDFNMNKNDF